MGEQINVDDIAAGRSRLADLHARDRDDEAAQERARRGNTDFVQVYPKGWRRLQELMRTNISAARVYAFLAENIDGSGGAVVVSQELMAQELGVHKRTVMRLTQHLEDVSAIVRIRVGTGVYAYALDPTEIWRSWDDKKDTAVFRTRTLVAKKDRNNGQVRRKLKVMMDGPELFKAGEAEGPVGSGDSEPPLS